MKSKNLLIGSDINIIGIFIFDKSKYCLNSTTSSFFNFVLPFYKTADIIIGVKVNLTKLVSIALFALLPLGCNSDDATKQFVDPQSFESTQECHVCGMVIVRFPGPKAQAFETRGEQMRKFCSTMEMMIWYLQPENLANVSSVYVHDMTFSPWDKPKDKHLIDAKSAIYVLGSDMSASIGSSRKVQNR